MLANWSSTEWEWRMSLLKPRTWALISSTGQELYIQPEKLLQKNVDNFNLSPAVKDKLFLACGLGSHLFGLFTVLWDTYIKLELPKPSKRWEKKGWWLLRGWVAEQQGSLIVWILLLCLLQPDLKSQSIAKGKWEWVQCLLFYSNWRWAAVFAGLELLLGMGCPG